MIWGNCLQIYSNTECGVSNLGIAYTGMMTTDVNKLVLYQNMFHIISTTRVTESSFQDFADTIKEAWLVHDRGMRNTTPNFEL